MGEGQSCRYREPSPYVLRFFRWYTRRHLRRHFAAVYMLGERPAIPEGVPAVVFGSHPSWWEPLTGLYLQERLFPGRMMAGPIEAGQLGKFPILGKVGLFGIRPGSAEGARDLLRGVREHFRRPGAMLWMTPQGRFADVRERPLRLAGGVEFLARAFPEAVFLPLALEYLFWNERLPVVLCHFGPPAVAGEMELALTGAMDRLAAAAITRDPGSFHCLLRGAGGTGGVYDWRGGE